MILCALADFENEQDLLESSADALIYGLEGVSARTFALLDPAALPEKAEQVRAAGKGFYLNFQAMIEEQTLPRKAELFETALPFADGIYIADEGYIQLAREYEKRTGLPAAGKLIYQPETLICSGEDAAFYQSCGLMAESLSHELSEAEILSCASLCSNLEVLIAGRYSWMESRRPLLKNYLSHIRKDECFQSDHLYHLRELQRSAKLPVWQDSLGTHILSDQPVQAGEAIFAMQQAGIHRFRVDAIVEGNAWAAEMCTLYAEALHTQRGDSLPECSLPESESLIRKEKTHVH